MSEQNKRNVVTLPGYILPVKGEPNQEVLEVLERYAEMARAGRIQCIAIAAVDADREVLTSKFRYNFAPVFTMLGAVVALQARVQEDIV